MYRYRWAVSLVVLFCLSVQAVDARIFDRLRNRRNGGGGDGNVTTNAPEAPADLGPAQYDSGSDIVSIPTDWTDRNNCVQSYDANGMPVVVCDQNQTGFPVRQGSIPVAPMPQTVVRSIPVPVARTVVDSPVRVADRPAMVSSPAADLASNARINAILDVIEERLGLTKQPEMASVEGDPTAMLAKLPKVGLELKTQEGEIIERAEFDLKAFVLEQLNK